MDMEGGKLGDDVFSMMMNLAVSGLQWAHTTYLFNEGTEA
jgi:hypothetical protein